MQNCSFTLLLNSQFKITLKYVSGELVLHLRVFLTSDLSVRPQHQVTDAQSCPVSRYTQGMLINYFILAQDVAQIPNRVEGEFCTFETVFLGFLGFSVEGYFNNA